MSNAALTRDVTGPLPAHQPESTDPSALRARGQMGFWATKHATGTGKATVGSVGLPSGTKPPPRAILESGRTHTPLHSMGIPVHGEPTFAHSLTTPIELKIMALFLNSTTAPGLSINS